MGRNGELMGFFIGLAFGALVSSMVSSSLTEHFIRSDAIENTAAHYEVDPKTGKTTFVWDGKE